MFEEATVYSPVIKQETGKVSVIFAAEHPGARDPGYQRHRAAIAALALNFRDGDPVPDATYMAEEVELWKQVVTELKERHRRHASAEFLDGSRRLALPADRLPQLSEVKLSHAWTGYCSATFDLYPHIGEADGIHYAMGYCFAGIPAGTYFGHKTALNIMGSKDARTAFDDRPFPTKWFYFGKPWFVAPYMANYRRQDRKDDRVKA